MRFFFPFVLASSFGLTACENCPDRTTEIDVTPAELERGVPTAVEVTFPEDVFLTPADAGQLGLYVELRDPDLATAGRWHGSSLTATGAITAVSVVDARRLTVSITVDATSEPSTYELSVQADGSPACPGPNGTEEIVVR